MNKEAVLARIVARSLDNPISRAELAQETTLSDREVRRIIRTLRESGIRIAGTSKSKGYYLIRTESEYKDFRRDYLAKATSIYKAIMAMDEATEGRVEL